MTDQIEDINEKLNMKTKVFRASVYKSFLRPGDELDIGKNL